MLHHHASPAVAGRYLIGAVLGGLSTAMGLLLAAGLMSPLPATARAIAFVLAWMLLALHATRVLCLRLPERTYQIPRETFADDPDSAAFRFAYELGLGFRTYVTATSPYALALALVLIGHRSLGLDLVVALAAGVGFGLGRARVVAGQAAAGSVALDHPARWLRAADLLAMTILATVGVRALL